MKRLIQSFNKLGYFIGVVVLLGAIVSFSGCMPYSTGATEVGVRTVKWSLTGNSGVENKVYPPGSTFFMLPFINDWHTFDTRLQVLEMTESTQRGDLPGRDELLFKTIDGNDIALEVIVAYRIKPEQAPMVLQEVAINDQALKEAIVRTVARSKPRDLFGELNTEEFYIAEERSRKAEEVRERLNQILEPYGVVVEQVGTKDYRFNPQYEKAIEQKKIADQEAERLRSETNAKREEYLTLVEQALAVVEEMKARADGDYRQAVIAADAHYEQQERIAQAIIAEGEAEAEGIRAMNEALAGAGGEAMVKLAIAEALTNKRIMMLPMGNGGLDVRSTDINALLQLYGLESISRGTASGTSSSGSYNE